MPRILISCLFLGLACATAKWPFPLQPSIPRKTVIDQEQQTVMVANAKVAFDLVVPKDASPAAHFAGKEMSAQLSQAFSVPLAVKQAAIPGTPAIILGDVALAQANGIIPEALDRDGFVIRTINGNVLIIGYDDPDTDPFRNPTGTQHATLFGVYDFLERFAGIRYYFPGDLGTIIPKRTDWSLPNIDLYDRPDLFTRKFSYGSGTTGVAALPYEGSDWENTGRRLCNLRYRHGNVDLYYCHALAALGYRQRFEHTHPEYFALGSNGKRIIGFDKWYDRSHLCCKSGIKQEIIEDAVSFLTGEDAAVRGIRNRQGAIAWNSNLSSSRAKGEPFFSISPNDGLQPCHCPLCKAEIVDGTPLQKSNHIWQFFADIAQALKDRGVPGYITSTVYSCWTSVPEVTIPDNMMLDVSVRGPWNERNPVALAADQKLLRDWYAKIGRKFLQLWTYPGKYAFSGLFPGIPAATPRASATFTRWASQYTTGIYQEKCSDRVIFSYLEYFIYGKSLWDVNVDVDALLDEHARLMFGPAAVPMAQFFQAIEDNWHTIAANAVDTTLGPKPAYPTDLKLWGDIYSPQEMARLTALFDQSEALCQAAPEYLARVNFMRREYFGPLLQAAANYHDERKAANAWRQFFPAITAEQAKTIVLDGQPDEAAWQHAARFHLGPKNGIAAEVTTVVHAMYDDANFYFAFDCQEPNTPAVSQRRPDDPNLWQDDDLEFFLSPDRNLNIYYQFILNCLGQYSDRRVEGGKNGFHDLSWNSGAEYQAKIDPGKRWAAEIRIPRSSLPDASPEGILADFDRQRIIKERPGDTSYCWSPNLRTFGDIERFGTLTFQPDHATDLISDGSIAPDSQDVVNRSQNCELDTRYFVSHGASIRLTQGPACCRFYVDIKPDTEYELSFFLKMEKIKKGREKQSGFFTRTFIEDTAVRFPDHGREFDGTLEWKRFTHRFRSLPATNQENNTYARKPFVALEFQAAEGSAWIDDVKLIQVQ